MERPMLACGCQAHATSGGLPSCVIHNTTEQVQAPDLSGRLATCSCGRKEPSERRSNLAFFEYRGPGSRWEGYCSGTDGVSLCGRIESAHPVRGICSNYQPRVGGFSEDSFYCGCRGWD